VKRETKNDSLTDDRLEDAGLRLPAVQTVALLVVLGIFGITTAIYIGNWSSNLAIYSRAVAVAPDNAYAHNSLAEQLFNHMRFNDALSQFRQALAADPENTQARTSLGQSYGFFGQWADAARQLRVAAQLAPTACAFTALAEAQRKAGQLPEAEASYRHALALPSCPPHTHWAMAEMLRQEGKLAEARAEYQAEQAESPAPDVQQHIDELDRLLRTPLSR
jgi:Flp pilus assembly protein TadD